jgi:adenylate kinase
MGKIASGKGTQAHAIADSFGGHIYSNGNKVRSASEETSVFGNKMKEMYEGGLLMPEWIATYWMTHAIVAEHATHRIIFEAVAKKPKEAELFHEIHEWLGRPYVVFNLVIDDETVHARSAARARDAVDAPKSVQKRLEEYHTYTEKSIEYFRSRGTLYEIDGSLPPHEVTSHITNCLTN